MQFRGASGPPRAAMTLRDAGREGQRTTSADGGPGHFEPVGEAVVVVPQHGAAGSIEIVPDDDIAIIRIGEACIGAACIGAACIGAARIGAACIGAACIGSACFGAARPSGLINDRLVGPSGTICRTPPTDPSAPRRRRGATPLLELPVVMGKREPLSPLS